MSPHEMDMIVMWIRQGKRNSFGLQKFADGTHRWHRQPMTIAG